MSPITHFIMGWAVANTLPSLAKRDRAFVTWASVVPDIDGLGIIAEKLSDQWALNAWPNVVVTAVLIGITVVLARQRGFSPLEMFSAKADAAFVRALRNRFPVRTSN